MTEDDARAVAELFSSLVAAILFDMRLQGAPRERMQQFLQLITDTKEVTASDQNLQGAVLAHLAVIASIIPPNEPLTLGLTLAL
jgi:hypothetical protein